MTLLGTILTIVGTLIVIALVFLVFVIWKGAKYDNK